MRCALLLLALGATGWANDELHGLVVGIAVAAFTELGIRGVLWGRKVGIF